MTDMDVPPEPWPASRSAARLLWEHGFIDVRVMRAVDEETLLCSTADSDEGLVAPDLETAVEVQWADDNGLCARPAVIALKRFDVVTLLGRGDARREQRRRYYRAPVSLDIELVHGHETYHGRTNDLSEGGARMTVDGVAPVPRTRVTTRVNLQQRLVSIPTTVVRGEDGELGVEFGEVPPPEADAIRRQVINAQIDQRRRHGR